MAEEKDYISNAYNALKERVNGFNRTPEEFRTLMSSDSTYRNNAYKALKDNIQGFNRTPKEFNSLVIGDVPKEPKYQKSVQKDRSETGKLLAATWNNFVSGFESLATGVVQRTPQDPFSYIQPLTGKQKTVSDVVSEQIEMPKKQIAIKEEISGKIEKAFGKVKSEYITPEEQSEISEIDFTSKGFIENAKALVASGGRLASDIPMGILSFGSTYYLQGYGESVREYDKMVKKGELQENPIARELYGNTVGTVNAFLEKLAIDKIFGVGPAFKNIQKKVISDTFKKISKSTGAISTKSIENIIENEIRALASTAKSKGIKVAYSAIIEGGTEGLQTGLTEGAKIITNKIQGQEVFNEKDIYDNIGKNIFNSTIAGGIYGAPMGTIALFNKNVNKSVLEDVAKAKTEEDFNTIRTELENTFNANNYSQEDRDATMTTLENYARIKQKLPPLAPPQVQERVIPLVEQRDGIDLELNAKKLQLVNLDESISEDAESEIKILEDKRASINDEIRSEVSGVDFNYFEQEGKFFKQLGENAPEEITKTRYDIESIRKEDKQLSQDAEDAPTVLEMMDKPVIINGERATLIQDGQTVVAKVLGKERIIEVGNIDEIGSQKLSDVGITQEESIVGVSDTGNVIVRGTEFVNLFTDPLAAINRDDNGNIVSVNLETEDGKKRTFRGGTADDVAYQIIIKNLTENNETRQQFEDFVESNEPIKQELESGQVAEVTIEAAPIVTEQVPVVAETEVAPSNEVERLRAEEQKELLAAIPNIEEYKVNGVVDRNKITNEEDRVKFDEIYNKYDKLISPLVEPSGVVQPVTEVVAEERPTEKLPKMVTQTGLLAPANGRVVMVGEANPEFQNTFIILGEDTTIEMPDGETRDATFAVVEMDDILASHDENSFNDTEGYPSQNGMNANPRNYKTDAVAMDKVNRDAKNLKPSIVISDSATPETGVPIITTDGIVVSGNGRTMAIKLADRIAPEKYAEYKSNLEKRAAKFGIDPNEIKKMKNPVLVKIDTKIKEYSIKELDAYNQKAQKGESPVDKAIKRAGIISANQRLKDGILRIIAGYNTMSELFDNRADRSAVIDLLEANGIITTQERSEYVGANKELTEDGKDLVNDVLLATIISPEVMRATDNVKSFKRNIVNALPLLTENYKNKDYSLEELINNAILLQSDMVSRGYKLTDFFAFVGQTQLGRPHNPDVVVMNRMIAEGPNKFKDFVRKYNVAAETSEGGMFASEALTREQALAQLAKTEDKISENERKIIANLTGIYAEYERGQQAGAAKVFEQPIIEQATEQESEDFPEFVNGEFSNPKFEKQYQDEKTTAFGFTETREQFVSRKFC
jgi:hypothetical protein